MKRTIRTLFLMCTLFSALVAFSQDEEEESKPTYSYEDRPPSDPPKSIHPVSIRLWGGVPNPMSSRLFRKAFIGIYEINLATNIRIGNYMYAGLGYKNSLFSISNRNKYDSHTKLQLNSGFVRVGYDKYHTGRVFSSIYMNIGYTRGEYTGVPNMATKPRNTRSVFPFIQPTYSINFFGDEAERMRVGFYAAYNYMLWQFDPDQINLADVEPGISDFSNKSNVSCWSIGLELYIGLGKSK